MHWGIQTTAEPYRRPPFAWADAPDAETALKDVKTRLSGSPEAYDADALAPELLALPADPERQRHG